VDKWYDNGAYEGCDDDTKPGRFELTCPGWREPVKWEIVRASSPRDGRGEVRAEGLTRKSGKAV